MIIKVKKAAQELKYKKPDLITRSLGKKIYAYIKEKIVDTLDNEVIVLDFEDIKVIDSSFIDELVVKLIIDSWHSSKIFYIKLKNISEIAEINIDSVFKTFSKYNDRNIAVITEDIRQNNSFFIGSLDALEQDIIEYLRVNKSASLDDLCRFTGLQVKRITDILNALFILRLVRKDKNNIQSV